MKTTLLASLALAAAAFAETDSLAARLKARADEGAKTADPAVRAEYRKGIEAVAASGILDRAKNVGDRAPTFTLTNAAGEKISLAGLLERGPVVLTWYRGSWCPYCNIALRALQEKLPDLEKAGATLVALTPELPDKSVPNAGKLDLGFEVLTDLNHAVAEDYGIAFRLTPAVRDLYKNPFDLAEFNGAEAGDEAGDDRLPLAATYVIDRDGVIRWAFLDADYRKRAEPAEVVAAVENLDS